MLAGLFLNDPVPDTNSRIVITIFAVVLNCIFIATMVALVIRELIMNRGKKRQNASKVEPVPETTKSSVQAASLRATRSEASGLRVLQQQPLQSTLSVSRSPSYAEILRAAQRSSTPPSYHEPIMEEDSRPPEITTKVVGAPKRSKSSSPRKKQSFRRVNVKKLSESQNH